MSATCSCETTKFDGMSAAYRRRLWIVVAINALMFFVEFAAGHLSGSQALKADALDFLGDTATYAISLMVIGAPLIWQARAALAKGLSLFAMALFVLGTTVWHIFVLATPSAPIMGTIAILALLANVASVLLLLPYRDGDANIRSVWLCSRNDAIGNLFVVAAAFGVWGTATAWPDLIVAAIMGGLFLSSSYQIIRAALGELRQVRGSAPAE